MKKFRPFLSIIASLSLILITGCKFVDNDEANSPSIYIPTPSIKTVSTSVFLVGENIALDVSEVFIYRIETTATSPSEVHIGTIYPKKSSNTFLLFEDALVYKDSKYKYKYVYKVNSSTAYSSAWTREVEIVDGIDKTSISSLTYVVGSSTLKYNPDNPYKLIISANITDLDTDVPFFVNNEFKSDIILKANGISYAYELSSIAKDTVFTIPNSFSGKTLTCVGITGIFKAATGDTVYFTEPAPIKIVDASGNELTSITITAGSSDSGTAY